MFATLLIAMAVVGATDGQLADRAADAFRAGLASSRPLAAQKQFAAAAAAYDELRQRGVANVALYHNLGNAQLLAGDLPAAILSYRRGLRLDPTQPQLLDALAAARERVAYPASGAIGRPALNDRPPWLPRGRVQWLFPLAVTGYSITLLCVTRWLMTRRGVALGAAGVALALTVVSGYMLREAVRASDEERTHPLVVIAEDGVLVRRGDALTFPPRHAAPVNRGVEARLLFERGEWLQIELADGVIGWIPRRYAMVDAAEY